MECQEEEGVWWSFSLSLNSHSNCRPPLPHRSQEVFFVGSSFALSAGRKVPRDTGSQGSWLHSRLPCKMIQLENVLSKARLGWEYRS